MTNDTSELEEMAADFDVVFAKKPGGDAQHLVSPEDDYAICGVGLGDKVNRSTTPGPFDPLCRNCRRVIEGKRKSSDRSSISKSNG